MFYGYDKSGCTLYVPAGAKETYASTDGWGEFANIVEFEPASINGVKSENVNRKGVCYDLQGRIIENPTNGIYIIDGKKVLVR